MTLKLTTVQSPGDLSRERVVMRAQASVNVGDYAFFRCAAINENEVGSGDIPDAYWFEDHQIAEGDFVVLYTKSGTRSSKVGEDTGKTSHFFYWDRNKSLWSPAFRPVLLFARPYQFGPMIPAS